MIRSLRGEVLAVTETSVVLDVGGLGFDVFCSRGALSLCLPGERVRLTAYLQISEAGVALFGFANETEREIFLKIIAIKGIGGRTGMMILGVLSADEIVRAVSLADVNAFTRAPGVGRKTAERICFELKNSLLGAQAFPLTRPVFSSSASSSASSSSASLSASASVSARVATVGDALRSLGFGQSDVITALSVVRAALGEDFGALDEEKLLKAALKELQRK